ncbi:hypothetical protein [Streptomyces phaeofaciens]|jgi:hypothetical protein|uniref:hypothetical protein n=1 Tax=Streptomyces phaeofaciens TaxID=68254 RepID=UPI0036AE326E
MRNFGSKRKTLGAVAAVASLTLAASAVTIGTAHAAVKVTITGSVSCARFADSVPQTVKITPKKGVADSDETPGEDQVESYTIKLTGIPKNGTSATIKVVCVDDEDDTSTYKFKNVKIKKPTTGPLRINLR